MGSAILVAAPALLYVRKRRVDLLGRAVELPDRFDLNRRLIGGSTILESAEDFQQFALAAA